MKCNLSSKFRYQYFLLFLLVCSFSCEWDEEPSLSSDIGLASFSFGGHTEGEADGFATFTHGNWNSQTYVYRFNISNGSPYSNGYFQVKMQMLVPGNDLGIIFQDGDRYPIKIHDDNIQYFTGRFSNFEGETNYMYRNGEGVMHFEEVIPELGAIRGNFEFTAINGASVDDRSITIQGEFVAEEQL